jgi:hypothetical protein
VEGEADEAGKDASAGFLHGSPHDVLCVRAIVVGVVADLEAIGRWRWGRGRPRRRCRIISPWGPPCGTGIAPASVD